MADVFTPEISYGPWSVGMMQPDLPGLGYRTVQGGGSVSPAMPFTSVNADGWSVQYASTPESTNPLTQFSVQRAGYDATGAATTYTDTNIVNQRLRQPYPNQASLTALTCALDDYILSTDTVSGATNGSAEISPTPIVNWTMLPNQLVGDSITLEVTGNHYYARNGKPFAAVVFTVTDGTNTVMATASAMTVSGHTGDRQAVLVYSATINIASLATGLITCNAKVYPWIGAAASVADSSLSSERRGFSPRYFWKNTARASAPPLAYVSSTGVDASGVWSTNAATAVASPFLTVTGARNAIATQTGVTGGYVDGCRIRIVDSVAYGGNAATAITQNAGSLIVERAPGTAKASAILTYTAAWRIRLGVAGSIASPDSEGAIVFRDMTLVRSGGFTINGEAGAQLKLMFADDVVVDASTTSATFLSNSHLYTDGVTLNGTSANAISASAMGGEVRMLRGVLRTVNSGGGIENFLLIGSSITTPGSMGPSASGRSESGSIVQFNRFTGPTVQLFDAGLSADITNYTFSQNLVEVTTTTVPAFRVSGDSCLGNMTHVLIDNNTVTGYGADGRMNIGYDETPGTVRRTHKFLRMRNTIASNFYNKSDVFVGTSSQNGGPFPAEAPFRIGSWSYLYQVGSRNNFSQFINPGTNSVGADQGVAFAGTNTTLGTSFTVRNDPLFVNYQGKTASAGAGGGDYNLQPGSPCIGKATAFDEVFPFDLAGVARSRGAVGSYA